MLRLSGDIYSDYHRRLQSTPSYVDFVVVVLLIALLYSLLKILMNISNNWKKKMRKRVRDAMEKRKKVRDPFRSLNGYSWDYVMVFNIPKVSDVLTPLQEEHSLRFIIDRLANAGLQTKLFYSTQHDEVYCKIRCPMKRLMIEADRVNYKLLLEPTSLANKLREGHMKGAPEKQWKPVEVPINNVETDIDPYDYIYCDYNDDNDALIFKKYDTNSFLRGVDRLKLMSGIIAGRLNDGGAFLDVYRLMKDKCMLGFFPLHDMVELRDLEEKWLRVFQPPWKQYVDVVKDYFGEKIGLYFVWLGHYTTWLLPTTIVGFISWIWVAADNNNPNAAIMPYFATFMAVWTTLFLEYWKRKEKVTAMKWGMVGFEEEEQARPEFDGVPSVNPVNGSPILYFPRNEYLFRVSVSVSVISTLVLIVLTVVAGIFALRIILTAMSELTVGGVPTGGIITSLLNAIQIQVMNAIYGFIAIRLNDYENHRTDTQYEDALIAKTFIFQFVNSFAPFFYIAYVKPFITEIDPCVDSCMVELSTALGTIFLTRLATGSVVAVAVPYIMQKMRIKAESKGADPKDMADVELAFMQEEYHVLLGTFNLFAALMIQFGYTTMFIAAYPLATCMAFVSNYVEMRTDAWKLCQLSRRPEPRSCEDIGTWYVILEVISTSAVLTNSALVAFTGSITQSYTWTVRVWIFIIMSGAILACKEVIALYVPDVPREVEIQLERQKYYLSKLVDNIPDEDNDALVANIKAQSKFVILINDDDPL